MEKWFERLSTLDALFLELEDRTTHMHVGAVAVFEGKPPPYRDLLALIGARLDNVPRYRQRVVFVPFRQGRPVWIDESQFDLEYHVRHTALPAPGGEAELKRLGKNYEFHRYDGAGHAFFAWYRPNYRVEQAEDGWQKVYAFFGKHLGGPT